MPYNELAGRPANRSHWLGPLLRVVLRVAGSGQKPLVVPLPHKGTKRMGPNQPEALGNKRRRAVVGKGSVKGRQRAGKGPAAAATLVHQRNQEATKRLRDGLGLLEDDHVACAVHLSQPGGRPVLQDDVRLAARGYDVG